MTTRRTLAAVAAALTLAAPGLAGAEGAAPLADGKALFEGTCGLCHELARPLGKTKDRAGWETTVSRMVSNGAKLTPEEVTKVVDYLTARSLFQTKCSVCHGIDRPLGKSKDAAGWTATVQRMAAKQPGLLDEAQVAAIAAYLALERPATP